MIASLALFKFRSGGFSEEFLNPKIHYSIEVVEYGADEMGNSEGKIWEWKYNTNKLQYILYHSLFLLFNCNYFIQTIICMF